MSGKRTLRFKINLSIVVTFLVIAALFSVVLTVFETQRRDNAMAAIELSLSDLVLQKHEVLANEIFSVHEKAVRKTLQSMLEREGVVSATAYDEFGGMVGSTEAGVLDDLPEAEMKALLAAPRLQRLERDGQPVLSYTTVVRAYGEDVGFCTVVHSLETLNRETLHITLIFLALLLTLGLVMSGMQNMLMSRLVIGPVRSLSAIMGRVKSSDAATGAASASERGRSMSETFSAMAGDLAESTRPGDEIGSLARSFESMLGELQTAYGDLRQAEEKYRDIFENAVEGIFQLSDGRFLDANKAMGRLLGYESGSELVAASPDLATQCFAGRGDLDAFLSRVDESGSATGVEMRFLRAGGEPFWGSMSARAVRRADGTVEYYEGTLVDITERLEMEDALRERQAAETAAKARSVFLDNSGQGFLSFGPSMVVAEEFSRECVNIFGHDDLPGKPLQELLYAQPGVLRDNYFANIGRIFDTDDDFKRGMFLSLLPAEFHVGDKVVTAEHRYLGPEQMMLVLTDVTRQRHLTDEVARERRRLAFIVSVVKNREEFFGVVNDFRSFLSEQLDALCATAGNDGARAPELYRIIHTYKGLFALQNCLNLPETLHDLESALAGDREGGSDDVPGKADLEASLERDLDVLRDALGEGFLAGKGTVTIPSDKAASLKALARNMERALGGDADEDARRLVRELLEIDHQDLRGMLASYSSMTTQMAERLDKEVHSFEVEGDALWVDPQRYGPFVRSLVHVFRNAVGHGVEAPDQRVEAGKDEAARVTCRVTRGDGQFSVSIADDGRGIDLDGLAARAAEQGLDVDGGDAVALLFADGLSSCNEADLLAGRGVGLAAVKAELDTLGGSVELETSPGEGTRFTFILPHAEGE